MNFRRWVVFTFLIHVLVVLVDKGGGVVLYLLTANQAAQHGKSGIAASLPFVLSAVANLGLATALVYLVRRGRFSAQVCFETGMLVAIGWGGLVAAASAALLLVVLPWLDPSWAFDPWIVLPICAAVPLLLVASYANSTQLATERVKGYGMVHLVTSITFLPAFFVCFFWFGGSVADEHVPLGVVWGRLASTAIVALLALWLVRGVVQLRVRLHRDFLGEALRYGWKANLTSTLSYLNQRLDLIVLYGVLFGVAVSSGSSQSAADNRASTEVAYYSMAITWAELVWHFPEAMRDLFFSKVAGSTHAEARAITPVLSRLGLALSLVGASAILLLIDPAMALITRLARGDDSIWYVGWSEPVGAALLLLVPGTVAFTVSKILQADLAARDKLQTCVNAQVVVFVSMLALDFWWIPTHGALGAAAASTTSYTLGTVWTLLAYSRGTGTPVWRCLFVHTADFRYIRDILGAIIRKVRRSRA